MILLFLSNLISTSDLTEIFNLAILKSIKVFIVENLIVFFVLSGLLDFFFVMSALFFEDVGIFLLYGKNKQFEVAAILEIRKL